MGSDLKFGDVVVIPHKLNRASSYVGNQWWKIWSIKPFPKPVTGILIGFRTLQEGVTTYDEECGRYFTPKTYLKVALVALSAYKNPVMCMLDSVNNEILM